jgi:hypothetical protein
LHVIFGKNNKNDTYVLGFVKATTNVRPLPTGSESAKKKAPFCNEALKGSLNLKVSKGPEETTGRNQKFLMIKLSQGFPLASRVGAQKP